MQVARVDVQHALCQVQEIDAPQVGFERTLELRK
jgi:hypothetical protein